MDEMNDEQANAIIARLRAFKAKQSREKAAECPGPLEGVVDIPLQEMRIVKYCGRPCDGCEYIGEAVSLMGAVKTKYLCGKNGTGNV